MRRRSNSRGMADRLRDSHRSDLFIFDTKVLQGDVLLHKGTSHLQYSEYAVFENEDYASSIISGETGWAPKHLSHSLISEDGTGDQLFRQALREGYALSADGKFGKQPYPCRYPAWQGRVRQAICYRRVNQQSREDINLDGLVLTDDDYEAMQLHPATLQYVRRTTVESMFWDRKHERLSLILSFPADPPAPYDFLSMTYDIPERTTNILIRQSFDPHEHDVEDLEQYQQRMEACKSHWAHPLVTPVVLLQVQFARTEAAVAQNHSEVLVVEKDVSNMAGFDAYDRNRGGRAPRSSKDSISANGPTLPTRPPVYKKSTELMKNAHDVLKRSIRLLDTLNWMDRAIKILLEAGDALDDVRHESNDSPLPIATFPMPLSARGRVGTGLLRARIVEDPLTGHWHEIKQYLEGLQQLGMGLETDRTILEMRSKALVDIIYSKMAQEDNNLNARMAVASSRDSSSMKALAVITAIFLPGEFMSSLFGMSIFDWQDGENDSAGRSSSSSSSDDGDTGVVSNRFWIYWCLTVPLTIGILVVWRAWWVGQDRYFRKHLSKDLSEERYWTDDRRPRKLETSYIHDFIYMSVRRGESASENGTAMLPITSTSTLTEERGGLKKYLNRGRQKKKKKMVPPPSDTFRLRQMAFETVDQTKGHINGIV